MGSRRGRTWPAGSGPPLWRPSRRPPGTCRAEVRHRRGDHVPGRSRRPRRRARGAVARRSARSGRGGRRAASTCPPRWVRRWRPGRPSRSPGRPDRGGTAPRSTTAPSREATTWPLRVGLRDLEPQLPARAGLVRGIGLQAEDRLLGLAAPCRPVSRSRLFRKFRRNLSLSLGFLSSVDHALVGPLALSVGSGHQLALGRLVDAHRPLPRGGGRRPVLRGRPASRPRSGWPGGSARRARSRR